MHFPLSKTMSNHDLAAAFSAVAQIIALEPDSRFRARAYEESAVVIDHLGYELAERYQELSANQSATLAQAEFYRELEALPGIGDTIAKKLVTLFETGDIPAFQKYGAPYPGGMYPLMQIHGIGAKRTLALSLAFNLQNPATAVTDLIAKAKAGAVRELPGFGEKSEKELVVALESGHQKARIPLAVAIKEASLFKEFLDTLPGVKEVAFLGSLRRGAPEVGDIDIGVCAQDTEAVVAALKKAPLVKRVLVAGTQLISVITNSNWQVDCKFSPPEDWGSFIQHFTGSKQHNIMLRERALRQGLSLSEHGIKEKATGKVSHYATEEAFYEALGMHVVPPAERVGGPEFEKYG